MLSDVEPMVQKAQYAEAITKLKELSVALEGLPVGVKAKKRLNELQAKPEVKAQLSKAERTKAAADALAAAQKLKAEKKDDQAYLRFKTIAKDFADTPSGAVAAAMVTEYEKNPAFVKSVTDNANSAKAKSTLKLAQSYRDAGRSDLARKKYQAVIDEFPNTTFAEQARKEIASMN
jgi:outer membrane protein assembly factor BamD (BamD/ComL family)